MYEVNATIDCKQAIDEYIGNTDWRVRANSNTTYSNAGLVNNTAGKIAAKYWLSEVYSPEEGKAHIEGDYHIHDLDCMTAYCFTGDTKVVLLDGTTPSFKELTERYKNGEYFWVVSRDKQGNIVPGKAHHPRLIKHNAELMEITISGGAKIVCTPDHEFMLRDGSYRQAKDLCDNESLMSYNRKEKGQFHNHTVVSKKYLDYTEDVYCLTVDEHENFALEAGVFVHNCAGWNLRSLLAEGFNGVRSRVNSKPPKHLREALGQMANFLGILQSEWAGAQAFSSFDTFLAPYVFKDRMSFKNLKKAIRSFVYNLNVPSRWGQCVKEEYKCLRGDGKWVTHHELKPGDEIYVVDLTTGVLKKDVLTHVNIFDAPAKMHRYYNKQGFNFEVTDNHRVIYKTGSNGFSIKPSSELINRNAPIDIPISTWGEQTPNDFFGNECERGCRSCRVKEVESSTKKVWCPTTNTGTFVCMTDEGYIFLTGNSPFTNITIDWTVPDDLKEDMPLCGAEHLLYGINDSELIAKAKERGVDVLHNMTYKHFQPEMNMIQKAYYEVMTEGDSTGQPFTFPIPTVNITEEFDWEGENVLTLFENAAKIGSSYFQNFVGSQYKLDENGNRVEDEEAYKPQAIRSMCCRLQLDLNELRKRGNGLFGSAESTGSIGVVTINLARLGYRFKGDKEGLYKELDHLMELAKSTLEKKRVFVTDMYNRGLYPYTKRYLPAGFRNHFSTIGVNGGNEMIRNFTNDEYDITTEWGRQFAEELLNHIRTRMKEFQNETGNLYNLEASPGEGATHRFAREDIKRYPDIIQAGCKEKGQIYYTNSTQLPSWFTEDLFMALKLQDKLQTRYTGGCVEAGNYVITDRGRILIDELCNNKEKYKGIKVVSYNIETNKAEWDTVTDFHKIDVSDKDKIRIRGNASLDITTSDWHPFFVVTPGGKVEERRADKLRPGDYLLQNSTSLLNTEDVELTPELAYVLGFYIGDGSMSKIIDNRGGNNIEKFNVRFHHTNKDRLTRVASILKKNGLANINPYYSDKRSRKLMCLSTSAKAMTAFLNKYGFTAGKKALTVCLSDTLKANLNEANAYALLSGLFDTDSYLDPKYDSIEYFTGSKAMAEDVLWLANMLGIRCSLTVKQDARYDHPHFKLLFPARQLYKIEDRLMCTRRPVGIYKNSAERNVAVKGKYNVVMVKKVSKVDVEDNIFYDLTTEKNHNYLCGKTCYTFIHNTVFHMYMSEMISSPEACRDIVRKVLTNFKMPYITVTPLFSVCDKHGYLKGRHDFCPLCDEEILAKARQES